MHLCLSDLVFVFAGQWQDIGVLDGASFACLPSFTRLYYLLAYVEGFSRIRIKVERFFGCYASIFLVDYYYLLPTSLLDLALNDGLVR